MKNEVNTLEIEHRSKRIYEDGSFSFFIALMMITSVYLLPFASSVSVGEITIIISMLWIVIKFHKIRIYKDSALVLFVIYSVCISIMIAIMEGIALSDTISRLLRDSFYWILIYIFGYSYINYHVLKKWIKIICIALSVMIIMQFVTYAVTGFLIPGFFLNATVSQSATAHEIYQHTITMAGISGYLKANGFLTEGAHCGQALAIASIVIFDFDNLDNNNRKTILTLGLFSLASILTFSATGLALVAAVWLLIVWTAISSRRFSPQITISLFVLLFICFVYAFFIGGDGLNFSSVISRIFSAVSSSRADNSSFLRIYKGFHYWGGLPLSYKLFGIGFGNYSSLKNLSIGLSASTADTEYMNSMSYILVSSGLIGFILYTIFILNMLRKSNKKGRMMIILLVLMAISSSTYSSCYWVWMMLVIMANNKAEITLSDNLKIV